MSGRPKRILVVDDDPGVQKEIAAVLGLAGYEVETSPFLATAIGSGVGGSYDLITLDLHMPGIDGTEVARVFKERQVKTPIVVVSGFLDDSEESLRDSGIRYFLSKPFSSNELLAVIREALAE